MIESELKIPVADLDAIRDRLRAAGAECVSPETLEINILFDTAEGDLRDGRRVLRVRRVGERTVLTYKGPPTWEGAVKHRREIEQEITSAESISELFHELGYAPWLRYEKRRESWKFGAVHAELDHTPMGDFVEIEGPAEGLEATARDLGLDPAAAVPESYIGLWQLYREKHPGLGRDMVFDP